LQPHAADAGFLHWVPVALHFAEHRAVLPDTMLGRGI